MFVSLSRSLSLWWLVSNYLVDIILILEHKEFSFIYLVILFSVQSQYKKIMYIYISNLRPYVLLRYLILLLFVVFFYLFSVCLPCLILCFTEYLSTLLWIGVIISSFNLIFVLWQSLGCLTVLFPLVSK